jgi:hypothetical protein
MVFAEIHQFDRCVHFGAEFCDAAIDEGSQFADFEADGFTDGLEDLIRLIGHVAHPACHGDADNEVLVNMPLTPPGQARLAGVPGSLYPRRRTVAATGP